MKTVLIFGVPQAVLVQACQEGLQKLGYKVMLRSLSVYRERNYEPCDFAITIGLHGNGALLLKEHKEHNTPVYIIDYGYVRRGTLMYSNIDREKYYSLSLNGLNGRSDPLPSPMSPTRWHQLETPLQPWRTDGRHILICGQKTNDVALGMVDPMHWARQTIAELQKLTRKPLVFRPHPEDPTQKRPIGIQHSEEATFAEALEQAFAVVAYSSNTLVEATIAGVPTFAIGEGSMVEAITNKSLKNIDRPKTFDREQWAADLAWRQYTIDEFREGLPWKYAVEKSVMEQEPESEAAVSYEPAIIADIPTVHSSGSLHITEPASSVRRGRPRKSASVTG